MPGSLAELYGALLKQEPQGVLGAARFNPLMMAKALRQQQANPRPSLSSLMNYPQTWQQFGDNIQAHYPIDSPAAVRQAAFEAAKNAGPLMTVWQGSPHRFAPTKNNPLGEFDATKIGTGEGAQAYGYGHYLAENPNVAKGYRDNLTTGLRRYLVDGKPAALLPPEQQSIVTNYVAQLHRNAGNSGAAINALQSDANAALDAARKNLAEAQKNIGKTVDMGEGWGTMRHYTYTEADVAESLKSVKMLEEYAGRVKALAPDKISETSGHLYKVDLPDDQIAKMLDWDKPLSQQPEIWNIFKNDPVAKANPNMTGEQLYAVISRNAPDAFGFTQKAGASGEAAKYFASKGIPGIRYLDGGSRGAGTGTSNFVVFPGNEGVLKILARE